MSVVTYRGVKYDTRVSKERALAWKALVLMRGDDNFTYRGKEYHWKKEETNVWIGYDPAASKEAEKGKGIR